MKIAAINFQFPVNRAAEFGVGDHPADRALDEQFRVTGPSRFHVFGFMPAHISGKTHERFLVLFLAREPHFFGVDHDDEIAGIDVRRVDRFFFAAQKVRGFHGDTAEDLVLGVNDPPFAWDFVGFSGKRLHREREGTEATGEEWECQLDVGALFCA